MMMMTMDGPAADSGDGPPPPPPHPAPQSKTPPASPSDARDAKQGASRSPGTGLNPTRSSLPSRRPQLVRREDSSQDSVRGLRSTATRERSNSHHSHGGDWSGFCQRRGSAGRHDHFQGLEYNPNSAIEGNHQVSNTNTDENLILASLEHTALEDEAEQTLLDVLDRRRVTFARHGPGNHSGHRRNRSHYHHTLPSMDLLNLDSAAPRPSSAPASSEATRPLSLSRPPIAGRSLTQGRPRRNLLQRSPPSMSGRSVSSDWAFDTQGQLIHSFSESSQQIDLSTDDGALYSNNNELPRSGGLHKRSDSRHQRATSAFNFNNYDLGVSDSSLSAHFNTPWEKARHVVMTMKSNAIQAGDEPGSSIADKGLPDLMNIIEAQRDAADSQSVESANNSKNMRPGIARNRASLSLGTRTSAENHSFQSGNRSFENHGSTGHRPFTGLSSSPLSSGGFMSNIDKVFQVAEHVQQLCEIPEEEEDENKKKREVEEENATFLNNLMASHPHVSPPYLEDKEIVLPADENIAANEKTPMLEESSSPRQIISLERRRSPWSIAQPISNSRFYKIQLWWLELRKHAKLFLDACDPQYVKERLWDFLMHDVSLYIMPALAISAFYFYFLNNPVLSVLPTEASLSWLILFAVRNYLTLQLARVAEYLFVDVMATKSALSIHLVGPMATLYIINAKGWPFTLTIWGLLNFLLIQDGHHSNHIFSSHWLYFTDVEMFTVENSNGGVVQSEKYKEILLTMVIAGAAASLKRSLLSLYLGKRIYIHYKPKLEKVMESMILISEVANLGDAITEFEFEKVGDHSPVEVVERSASTRSVGARSTALEEVRASTMHAIVSKPIDEVENRDSDSDEESAEETSKPKQTNHSLVSSEYYDGQDLLENNSKILGREILDKTFDLAKKEVGAEDATVQHREQGSIASEELPQMPDAGDTEPPVEAVHEPVQGLLRDSSSTSHIKTLLNDDWEEPVDKRGKVSDPTVQEILDFKKALALLDDEEPFGPSFGSALTRKSCIRSSKALYKRLLALSPGDLQLPFDVICQLAWNIDGTFDEHKARLFTRLFRPDRFGEVSLLHFVASCDGVYKNLSIFRVAVGNSTLIDCVLENIFNSIFYFILILIILSVLELNPWTLLVSMSTVLVSFAFALGPSAAKIIEGMIMIAIRRPFDLGDRISIVDSTGHPDGSDDPGYRDTWIVEDCNLFTTTLRLSRTNEVSTVNNGAIANTRIVNHGRSLKALVNVTLRVKIESSSDQIAIVKSALEQYIRNNPRVWSALINMRITKVDPANGFVAYSARVQHVKSWQDLLPVLQARGDLEKYCTEVLYKLGILFECFVNTNDIFIKEMPDQQNIFSDDNARLHDEAMHSEPEDQSQIED